MGYEGGALEACGRVTQVFILQTADTWKTGFVLCGPSEQKQGQWMEVTGKASSPFHRAISLLATSERLQLASIHLSVHSTSEDPRPHGATMEW